MRDERPDVTAGSGTTSPNSRSRLGSGPSAESGKTSDSSPALLPHVTSLSDEVPQTMLSPSLAVPHTMLSPSLAVPQTMLSPSEVPHTTLSQSAPPQSVPQTMLSPS